MDLSLSQHWNLKELFLLGALAWWDGHGGAWKRVISFTWSHLGKEAGLVVPYKKEAHGKGRKYLMGKKIRNCCFLEGCVHWDCAHQQKIAAS